MSINEELLARTFDNWREEFKHILEGHRREIQQRLEQIEREIEKKSDKEYVDVLIRNIHEEMRRHAEELTRIHARVSRKMGTDTMWKIIGLVLTVGSALGGLIGFMINLLQKALP